MATKAEERKALEQIKKIIDGLGKPSYVAWAFDGCVEIAESNIDNDFANNPKEAMQTLRKNSEEKDREINELGAVIKQKEKEIDRLNDLQRSKDGLLEKAKEHACNNYGKYTAEKERADALQDEVIKLKAMLFDYMIKEKEDAK